MIMRNISSAAFLLLMTLALGCDSDQSTPQDHESTTENSDPKILGVCFMGEECMSTYIDLGPYEGPELDKTTNLIPVYMFPSVPAEAGGRGNPLDPNGLYKPFRLQNNVFAAHGKVWQIWLVFSEELSLMAEPAPGQRIWGVGADQTVDFKSGKIRDLFVSPIKSEAELLDLADRGYVRLENTLRNTDCPMIGAKPGDLVINLNPGFRICEQ